MIDTGIVDGSILIVDASRQPQSDDIVVSTIDGKYTVKRLRSVAGQFECMLRMHA
jgi:SOS-response transcriptional repressor LexA